MNKTMIHEFVMNTADTTYQSDLDALRALPRVQSDLKAIEGYLFVIAESYGWDESDRDAWAALRRLGKQLGVDVPRAPKR